ncbi:hypothetical protein K445DRAFT_315135 [Daldinia sp. EC12]|nr:hypothetical protein K445DRAFT_315135 [Daldinia sp. EC12]
MSTTISEPEKKQELQGLRKNGKQWHPPKKAFRPGSGLTSYEQRTKLRAATAATKAREKEMKEEKEAERQVKKNAQEASRTFEEEGKAQQAPQFMSQQISRGPYLRIFPLVTYKE